MLVTCKIVRLGCVYRSRACGYNKSIHSVLELRKGEMGQRKQRTTVVLLAILLLAVGWKALLLFMNVFPFNSDEAIVALMARHILQGARPVFFYGQAYMGSLDAMLVSLGFMAFGEQVWVIRLVQTVLFLLTIITTVALARMIFDSTRVGLVAGALLAIPTVNATLYTTVSLGGYGEGLLIGSLLLLVTLMIRQRIERERGATLFIVFLTFLLGLLAGLGLWANGLTLVFAAPAGLFWLWTVWQNKNHIPVKGTAVLIFVGTAGLFIGSAPWWLYAIRVGWELLLVELFGSAIAVDQSPWILRTLAHLFNFSVLGMTAALGLRPPWEVRWLAFPLLPVALAFWLAVMIFMVKQAIRPNPFRSSYVLLLGVLFVMSAGFILTPFGGDPSGRYFLPMIVPLSLAGAHMVHVLIKNNRLQALMVGCVVLFNFVGTMQCALRYPPGITTQFDLTTAIDHRHLDELMQFLHDNDERVGYTHYWVSYPLAFLSQEQLIFPPRLPYHIDMRYTSRDDRYLPYSEIAGSAKKVAYISALNPVLDDHLRDGFRRIGVTWHEKSIGDYRVFYGLSRPVHPEELGLGSNRHE
jgi:4-amino-4-deoxy-L-arabinose transferase-like glycosyltransferase